MKTDHQWELRAQLKSESNSRAFTHSFSIRTLETSLLRRVNLRDDFFRLSSHHTEMSFSKPRSTRERKQSGRWFEDSSWFLHIVEFWPMLTFPNEMNGELSKWNECTASSYTLVHSFGSVNRMRLLCDYGRVWIICIHWSGMHTRWGEGWIKFN